MRRMDYPIAKAKELNLNDKEWFQRDGLNWFLKKKLPNGIYHLTGYSNIQEPIAIHLHFYDTVSNTNIPAGYKGLFLIPSVGANLEALKNLTIDSFDDGLYNELPSFSISPESGIFQDEYDIYLIIKDGIVVLTTRSEL